MTTEAVEQVEEQVANTVNRHCYTARVDIRESEEAVYLEAEMPGVAADGVDVRLEDGVLTILGRVPPSTFGKALHSEYETGNFERVFRITEAIDGERISAQMRHGVLSLTLPKAESAKPKQIPVNAA